MFVLRQMHGHHKNSYMAITCHYITDTFEMNTVQHQCTLFNKNHTSQNLELFSSAIKEWVIKRPTIARGEFATCGGHLELGLYIFPGNPDGYKRSISICLNYHFTWRLITFLFSDDTKLNPFDKLSRAWSGYRLGARQVSW